LGQLKEGKRKFNLVLPVEMYNELQSLAETKGLTASAVIRMLVADYLKKEGDAWNQRM
jgi:predicted DNA-binding protein